jgi:hypothetical protein
MLVQGGEGKGVKGRGEGGVWEDFLWKIKLCIIETKSSSILEINITAFIKLISK